MYQQPDDPDDIAKRAIIDRFRRIVAAFHDDVRTIQQAEAAIAHAKQHQTELQAQAADCHAAARLFGFDLNDALKALFMAQQAAREEGQEQQAEPSLPPASPPMVKPPTIKELVLAFAQRAFPNPVRAVELRKEFEAQGFTVHEKTIGMTMYRWLKAGFLRREGWDWFFVPEDQRKPTEGNEGSPGERPPGDNADIFA